MAKTPTGYDFAGWVTRNDIRVSDGSVIKHNAFVGNHGTRVPLVWNHNHDTPSNTIGHMELVNMSSGVYGYGFFNGNPQAKEAHESVLHGDINAMSIGANGIKRQGSDIVHGKIFEVSLVLAGANPGAHIDEIVRHGDSETTLYIHTDEILHSAESLPEDVGLTPTVKTRLRASMIKGQLRSSFLN